MTTKPRRNLLTCLLGIGLSLVANPTAFADHQYSDEWPFNRHASTDGPPQFGLALSGGGIRSAFFSMGVLKGLADIGLLDQLDTISSVSGGGYAASWYYIQNLNRTIDPKTLFGLTAPSHGEPAFQSYLTNHGELVSHAYAKLAPLRWAEYFGVYGTETVGGFFVNAFANGLFGQHANVVPVRLAYERGIDRDFHVVPDQTGRRSSRDFIGFEDWSFDLNSPVRVDFPTLRDRIKDPIKGRLPFPIINMTAHIEGDHTPAASLLKNRVFEFTPLHWGNEYFGYQPDTSFPMDYNRAIEVAGAAVDSKRAKNDFMRFLFSIGNTDLGYFIDNPKIPESDRQRRKWMPFPFYFRDGHHQLDSQGDRIYLADGGHSENLATFSLFRRHCARIIIVDAGYDPKFEYSDYYDLQNGLKPEHGEINVPDIQTQIGKSPSNPVMTGTITVGTDASPQTIPIIYIKLAFNKDPMLPATKKYGDELTSFYDKNACDSTMIRTFPQRTTEDQSYTRDQVDAYRALGRFLVCENQPMFEKHLGLVPVAATVAQR